MVHKSLGRACMTATDPPARAVQVSAVRRHGLGRLGGQVGSRGAVPHVPGPPVRQLPLVRWPVPSIHLRAHPLESSGAVSTSHLSSLHTCWARLASMMLVRSRPRCTHGLILGRCVSVCATSEKHFRPSACRSVFARDACARLHAKSGYIPATNVVTHVEEFFRVLHMSSAVYSKGHDNFLARCPQKLLEIDTPAPKNMPSEYFARLTGD